MTLTNLITDDRILIHQRVDDWRHAITAVAQPLVADGSVTPEYVRAMIRAVETYGPYIVLTPHMALAHARPDGGVARQAMSVLSLAEPVEFGHEENDPVSIVFCLAAVDDDSHLHALREFVDLAKDADRLGRLIRANSVDEFQRILHERPSSAMSKQRSDRHG